MPLHAATDHNGTTYRSVKEMCEHWGIVLTTFYGRLNKGWSLEEALTTKANSTRLTEPAQDHLGNHFDTITAMCKHWGITTQIYYKRLNKGWELERILTTPPDRKPNKHKVIDADGREFKSIREFADFHNIPYSTALLRISKGMSVQELTEGSKRREVTAPDGTVFPNTSEMCRYYGVKRSTYQTRMEMGMTMSEALGLTNKDVKN